MTLGAEPKKVAILGVLAIAIVGIYFYNSSSEPASPPSVAPRVVVNTPPSKSPAPTRSTKAPLRNQKGEFRPEVPGSGKPEDQPLDTIDPALRLDLLAKVQAVEMTDAGRNLFQFGQAPAPPKPIAAVPKNIPQIPINQPPPQPQPVQPIGPPPAPPVTPLSFKYYGILVAKSDGRRQAFLQDGDDILFAQENEIVKRRYRIVKIAPTSIDIEDTQAKNTQTLKIQDLPPL